MIIFRCAISIFIAAALALALAGSTMPGSAPSLALLNEATVDAPISAEAETAAGTTFAYFGEVDQGIYKGSKPRTNADFEFLRARHIKYILDLELLPSLRHSEQKRAKRYGMVLLHGRLNASPIPPSHKHVERIMAILRNPRHRPIYFHCAYGRDRTSLVAALYKMYFLGMSQQDALRYMEETGYKDSWVRGGLKKYIEEHPSSGSK